MGRSLNQQSRIFVHALCVAFAVACVGIATIQTANTVEHAGGPAHEHGALAAMTEAIPVADHDHHSSERADVAADAPEHAPAIGHHHHADTLTGVAPFASVSLVWRVSSDINATLPQAAPARGIDPAALKRPPRTPDIAV